MSPVNQRREIYRAAVPLLLASSFGPKGGGFTLLASKRDRKTATASGVSRVPESCSIDTAFGGVCSCYWVAGCGVFGVASGVAGGAGLSSSEYTSIESCDEAIKADRANVQAWIDRGVIHARQGLDEEAANDFDTASALLDRKG